MSHEVEMLPSEMAVQCPRCSGDMIVDTTGSEGRCSTCKTVARVFGKALMINTGDGLTPRPVQNNWPMWAKRSDRPEAIAEPAWRSFPEGLQAESFVDAMVCLQHLVGEDLDPGIFELAYEIRATPARSPSIGFGFYPPIEAPRVDLSLEELEKLINAEGDTGAIVLGPAGPRCLTCNAERVVLDTATQVVRALRERLDDRHCQVLEGRDQLAESLADLSRARADLDMARRRIEQLERDLVAGSAVARLESE